ncbi:hypothetical protein ABZ816_42635 [Actinosynnema sp. NPDC047251]|uniref:SalK n=1 Tax=Saccharothrix espanaensis (strain ATCC 51144 / DSM 44229 / JCM 9112 / NBRC 15066 / NRRL 15764) TaxID=1179773 RepID=K0K2P5_SACES|nr:hypothetical protein [Saccharothrix espanaensis]CCH34520.1 hypothetical protein BN6_72880 [Saccharothrix espanaensis DSM 44229]
MAKPSPRDLWLRFETYHDVTYFTPESRAATDELGCKGGWMGYFGMRAAPLGAASPEAVAAAFYSFHPRMVSRALPDAWDVASPERFLETRLRGVDGALRRMLPTLDVGEPAALARDAATEAAKAGRVLGAANAALELPEEPHLALWQACTTLRELRGDGHIAALVAADLTPCETLVLFGADKGLDPAYLRTARGWNEDEWAAAEASLGERGLYSAGLTVRGAELRREIERRTDHAAQSPWKALGPAKTARFEELMTPLVLRLARQNEAMRVNPMAIDPVRELTT